MPITEHPDAPKEQRVPWNKGQLVGQKRPLRPKDVWSIRARLEIEDRERDLALFNLAIDSKLRASDLVSLRIEDVQIGGRVRERATIIQQKTARPVQFELTDNTRKSLQAWPAHRGSQGYRRRRPRLGIGCRLFDPPQCRFDIEVPATSKKETDLPSSYGAARGRSLWVRRRGSPEPHAVHGITMETRARGRKCPLVRRPTLSDGSPIPPARLAREAASRTSHPWLRLRGSAEPISHSTKSAAVSAWSE